MGGSLPKPGDRIRLMADAPPSRRPRLGGRRHADAIARATALGCTAAQIFVKNASQWQGREVGDEEAAAFRAAHAASAGGAAGRPRELSDQPLHAPIRPSWRARARRWPTSWRAAPGWGWAGWCYTPGRTWERARRRGSNAWRRRSTRCWRRFQVVPVRVLLENTAGQGSCLGHRLEHLAAIRDRVAAPDRVGICLDTCHAFAAGYAAPRAGRLRGDDGGDRGADRPRRPGVPAPQRFAAPVRLPARPPRPHRRGGDRPRRLRPPPPRPAPRDASR